MSDYNFAIEAKNLNKTYNKKKQFEIKALVNFNINIPKGSSVGIIGETGSGKSTMLDIIMGLLMPTQGNITIDA